MSKGDSPRPHDPARYRSEWDRIFIGLAEQRVEQLRQERYAAIHGLAESEAMDEHARLWSDEFGTETDGVVTDVTLDFSLEMIRRDPARGEQRREDEA